MSGKAIFWVVLAALALPMGNLARAEEGRGDKPALGGPKTGEKSQMEGRKRIGDGGNRRGGEGDKRGEGQGAGPMADLLQDLNLTEDQKVKAHKIMEGQREKRQAAQEKNRAEIDKLDQQIKDLMEKRRQLSGGGPEEMAAALKDVLTPEQQKKLQDKIGQMKERREQGPPQGRFHKGGEGDQPRSRRDGGGNFGGSSGGGSSTGGGKLDL